MFGPFANLVMIGLRCDPGSSYRDFVRRVREHVTAVQANAEIPQLQLREELAARGISLPEPLVKVHVRTPHPPLAFAGLRLAMTGASAAMQEGITIGFNQFSEAKDCYLAFDERLYAREMITVLIAAVTRFLDEAAIDPDASLATLVERSGIEPMRGRSAWVSVPRQHQASRRDGFRTAGRQDFSTAKPEGAFASKQAGRRPAKCLLPMLNHAEKLRQRQGRQDRWQPCRQHRLVGTGRADHQHGAATFLRRCGREKVLLRSHRGL